MDNRELDKRIAIEVMGWYERSEDVWVSPVGFNDIPKYSTDISAAFEIVEKLREEGIYLDIRTNADFYEAKVLDLYYALPSLPEAICRVALLSLEGRA